jgi:8-amino-7-oxononanoate synthase
MNTAQEMMEGKLSLRQAENSLRKLSTVPGSIDFSSNDYLGFSRSAVLNQRIKAAISANTSVAILGATGSRLLTGNSLYAEELEKEIALIHLAADGLIFNSGYAANTALFSCLPQKGDTVITDEYIHASVIDGIRLSYATRLKFRHNNPDDLEHKLKRSTGRCYVVVESIYSMDGDIADLSVIAGLCTKYDARLIVDEAHAFGVLDTGLVDKLRLQEQVFARVITFGKALGLHGAIIIGQQLLKDYLVNFARPFIYSTALPLSHLISIRTAYQYLKEQTALQASLTAKSALFIQHMPPQHQLLSTQNQTPVQCVFAGNIERTRSYSSYLREQGFDVRAILSPTVPKGRERLRICIHIHNTNNEITDLCKLFHELSYS